MSASTLSQLENSVRATAIRRLGATDASVHRHQERPPTRGDGDHGDFGWGGDWHGLFVKFDGDWQMVGRRRTMAELLEFASTIDPNTLNGWPV